MNEATFRVYGRFLVRLARSADGGWRATEIGYEGKAPPLPEVLVPEDARVEKDWQRRPGMCERLGSEPGLGNHSLPHGDGGGSGRGQHASPGRADRLPPLPCGHLPRSRGGDGFSRSRPRAALATPAPG